MKKYKISINQEVVVKTTDVKEGVRYLVDCIKESPNCDAQELPDDYENEDGSEIPVLLTDEEWINEVMTSSTNPINEDSFDDDWDEERMLDDEEVYDIISDIFYEGPNFLNHLRERKKEIGDEFNLFNEVVCLIYDVFNRNNFGDELDYSNQIDNWCERHRDVIMERFKKL